MAGGLNKKFLANPLDFLAKNKISVVDGNMQTSANLVGFYADQERVLLKQFLCVPSKHQHPFSCYFLRALPNERNLGASFQTTTETYFFTSTLSGCQFLLYGQSKNVLMVEHNNCLTSGSYVGYHSSVPSTATHSVRIHNGGDYDITKDDVGNVVGIRGLNGWDFYFQKIARDQRTAKKTITVTHIL